MSSVQSLGLREPSALVYLVAESILPEDPSPSLYKWSLLHTPSDAGSEAVEEEVLFTNSCAVWSRNGLVKRALNLNIEGESILHAFVTNFNLGADEGNGNGNDHRSRKPPSSRQRERGLVVVLKTQAHIFLFSGDTQIVPLSFEVEAAFPLPSGFILQRKLGNRELGNAHIPTTLHHDLSTINETLTSIGATSSRPSILSPQKHKDIPELLQSGSNGLPRTFSYTEIMSELSLVVYSPSRRGEPLDDCKALPQAERIIFISSDSEMGSALPTDCPSSIALTLNDSNSSFTLWHITSDPSHNVPQTKYPSSKSTRSRASIRKSSNVYGRDPGGPPTTRTTANLRESLTAGIYGDGLFPPLDEQGSFPVNDLASQLGPEFGDVGVQTRSARRVSSMLARTDLGAGNDRNTFNDLAMGHPARQSLNRAGRRGESIGSFNDRHSFGFRRRSSFPATASMLSAGTSFLDMSARGLLDEFDPLRHSSRLEDEVIDSVDSSLPRDLGFFKVKNFARSLGSEQSGIDRDIKVLTLSPHASSPNSDGRSKELYVCVMDRDAQELILIKILIRLHQRSSGSNKHSRPPAVEVKATDLRRLSGIRDACKVQDGPFQRLLVLTQSRTQHTALHLEAPWSPSFRVELMQSFTIFDPFTRAKFASPKQSKETGMRRTIPTSSVHIQALKQSAGQGHLCLVDQEDREHYLRLKLRPRNPVVDNILQMCDMAIKSDQQECLLVAFWEVSRWLESKDLSEHSEWTALVVVLFSLAVPFISAQPQTPGQRRRKSAFLRSSSGTAIDLTDYDAMHNDEHEMTMRSEGQNPAWDWLSRKQPPSKSSTQKPKFARSGSNISSDDTIKEKKNLFLAKCITLAKEYVQTPTGENAIGPEGYLPTSVNKNREQRCNAVASILLGLHVLYEESKLSVAASSNVGSAKCHLVLVMAQFGHWLGWVDWTCEENNYYEFEVPGSKDCLFDLSLIDGLKMPAQPFPPPSIYSHLEDWVNGKHVGTFLTLARIAGVSSSLNADDPIWQRVGTLTPRTLGLLTYTKSSQDQLGSELTIQALSRSGIEDSILRTLPDGVAAALHQAILSRRSERLGNPVSQSIAQEQLPQSNLGSDVVHSQLRKTTLTLSHEALRDYHAVCSSALDAETLQRWDASSEADRHAITKLIFSQDRRFPEASKLVNQTRPPVVECTPEPDWTEVELLEAQKELAQHVTRRTLSVSAGRGMMHFNARVPLLTERVPIPAFSLQCIMKPRHSTESTQAMTFSADKAAFTEEKVCWAFFHNGASMGLMIANDAQGIDTSWILYNKPPELTNRHAGFLLALGLNGHLKSLAKWVAFKYLTPKHTMTSVGLILGLSASFLGTMDTLVTRLLSVHVTRLLPPGAAELNLSPLTQTTGIIGIGLLYYNSQHRRMSEVMLSEIENNDSEEGVAAESVLRDEGYRLAAGFSLGLINLGHGKRLHGLHDMGVVERLLAIAVGTKNVNMVHVLDRATAGAVMAIAFVFLKTNDEAIAHKVDVPDTLHQFDYVRPDVFLLRTLARHLIMWNSIQPTIDFIRAALPQPYRARVDLRSTKVLSTEDMPFFNIVAGICFAIGLRFAGSQRHDVRDLLVAYLDQFLRLSRLPARNYDARVTLNSTRNCLDITALATASVMAGSGDLYVMRRLRALHGRTDKETPFGSHLAAHMALGTLFLAGGTRTFGTSDLAIASLCIAFYPIFPNDVLDNRGHLQALRHLWVLAVEGRCLVARDRDADGSVVGGITADIYFKNGEMISLRVPSLIPELDSIARIEVKGEGFWDRVLDFTAPSSVEQLKARLEKENAINVFLSKRTAYDKPPQDLFAAEFQARSDAGGIPSVDQNGSLTTGVGTGGVGGPGKLTNSFEWLFDLDGLKDFDHAERALVLASSSEGGVDLLETTVVDARLEFEKGILPFNEPSAFHFGSKPDMQKNKLWQLRLLFAWFDRWEREDEEIERRLSLARDGVQASSAGLAATGDLKSEDKWFASSGGTWLRREVIERLRYRVWEMTTGAEADGE